MDTVAIRCEGIGKRYKIGQRQRYHSLRDTLANTLRTSWRQLAPWGTRHPDDDHDEESLWALQDISLEIRQGEALGIVGRNGAGKSTLLKILARITKPTAGRAEIRGRVGSLLEVGTGFHPELTGRENIYLNGAILGMTKREIEGRFEEIVEFSECGRFIDTPVKHYSSGMYMRLAFSVAAHLQTEVLFVDEVLAVGDAAFQKKCLGKMGDAAHHGRTVVFVSHNLEAVGNLCTRAICLHEGRLVMEGPSAQVASRYLQSWIPTCQEVHYQDRDSAPGDETFRLRRACVRPVNGSPADLITVRTPFVVEFEYWKLDPQARLDLGVDVFNEYGTLLFAGWFGEVSIPAGGLLRSWFTVPGDLLNNGQHRIKLGNQHFDWDDLLVFEIHGASDPQTPYVEAPGVVRPRLEWQTQCIDSSGVPLSES